MYGSFSPSTKIKGINTVIRVFVDGRGEFNVIITKVIDKNEIIGMDLKGSTIHAFRRTGERYG